MPPKATAAVAAAVEIKNLHPRWMSRGDLHECGHAMKCTYPTCTFGMGITCGPFWRGRSSPPCTITLFLRTGICAGCAGRTTSVKTSTPPPPQRWQPPSTGYLKWFGGNGRGAFSLAAADPPPPTPRPNPQAFTGLTSRGKSSQRLGVETKRQLTGKYILSETHIANSTVDLDPQPDNTINSSASTSSPALSNTLYSTQGPDEGVPIPDPASPTSIPSLDLRDPIPASPFTPNPDPPRPAQLALAPYSSTTPSPKSVTFDPSISEALPYAMMAQAPYPPPVAPLSDELAATDKATSREILRAPSLLSFFSSKQGKTLGGLSERAKHLSVDLLRSYV